MAEKTFGWRGKIVFATSRTPSKDTSAEGAPAAGAPAVRFGARKIADGKEESVLTPAPVPKT